MQLRIPGPTPCPPRVLDAMGKQMINHRGREFGELMERITESLKKVFQTKGDVFVLTGAGTGGLEAAIVNSLSPGDEVLSVSIGVFGERFADIAEKFGARVKRLRFEWGSAADLDEVRRALKENPNIKAVLITHNETSTGVTNDLASLSRLVKEFDKLLLVDAVSSLSCIDLPTDAWHCDIVITGSQKGWMSPPGLAMLSMSEDAWKANSEAKMRRFYWDLARAKSFLEKSQTPWTPAVSTFYALDSALGVMEEEGLSHILARHARVGRAAREGIKSLGLSLFADEAFASNTVTAIKAPDGLDVNMLRRVLREEHQVIVAGGQQKLAGKIFRIGHMGWVDEEDIEEIMKALKEALPKAGFMS